MEQLHLELLHCSRRGLHPRLGMDSTNPCPGGVHGHGLPMDSTWSPWETPGGVSHGATPPGVAHGTPCDLWKSSHMWKSATCDLTSTCHSLWHDGVVMPQTSTCGMTTPFTFQSCGWCGHATCGSLVWFLVLAGELSRALPLQISASGWRVQRKLTIFLISKIHR